MSEASNTTLRFDSVSLREEWGVADATGFHLEERHRYAPPSAFPFSVCRIDGRQIAVFIDVEVPMEGRAALASRKPEWLEAVVYARSISDPWSEIATIEAHASPAESARPRFAPAKSAYPRGGVGEGGAAPSLPRAAGARTCGEGGIRMRSEEPISRASAEECEPSPRVDTSPDEEPRARSHLSVVPLEAPATALDLPRAVALASAVEGFLRAGMSDHARPLAAELVALLKDAEGASADVVPLAGRRTRG